MGVDSHCSFNLYFLITDDGMVSVDRCWSYVCLPDLFLLFVESVFFPAEL